MASTQTVERDPETLELFIEESREGLERVEKILVAANDGPPPSSSIAALFRDLHTIKGTAGFLALPRTGHLAHAAEDLLARLRDEELEPHPVHTQVLIAVADVLRGFIDEIRNTGDEGTRDVEQLVTELKARASGDVSPRASSPPLAANDAPAPETALSLVPPAAKPAGDQIVVQPQGQTPAPAAAPAQEERTVHEAQRVVVDATVRVGVGLLDELMDLTGELVLARNQLAQGIRKLPGASDVLNGAVDRLSWIASGLQERMLHTRMQPIGNVLDKLPRIARDVATTLGKRVEAEVTGGSTGVDKALLEAIRDPLMHIVRNAIDHGLEDVEARKAAGKSASGKLSIRAGQHDGQVVVDVEDDGRGMSAVALRAHAVRKGIISQVEADRLTDTQALELVFMPGFSTASNVTDISGRGVGMDVVRTYVERIGGRVELHSSVGVGTLVRLRLPLTLAIMPALLVTAGGSTFAIPHSSLVELVHITDEADSGARVVEVGGVKIYRKNDDVYPLIGLAEVLDVAPQNQEGTWIVVVNAGTRRFAMCVDSVLDTEEIVVKPLHDELHELAEYSGATILGDGQIVLILNLEGIATRTGVVTSAAKSLVSPVTRSLAESTASKEHLVFTVRGGQVQCAVPLSMVARLAPLDAERVEMLGARETIQYDGAIIPLVRPESALGLGAPVLDEEAQLIVLGFGQRIGLVVSSINDVTEIAVDRGASSTGVPHTLGSVILNERSTLLLDVYGLGRALVPGFEAEPTTGGNVTPRVLLADDSHAMRAAVGGFLRAAGIEVLEATSGASAIEVMRSQIRPLDAVVTDLEMPSGDGFEVLAVSRREWPTLPVIVWTQRDVASIEKRASDAGARACINKLERESLMRELRALGLAVRQRPLALEGGRP